MKNSRKGRLDLIRHFAYGNIEATKDNLDKFADQLAKTASSASASVAQMGEAILTVGGTAANLAGGTTELNTVLGLLANAGVKGAEGGTHLRNILLRLQAPTDDASKALEKLGVSVYDTQGNMRSLGDIFGDIKSGMNGLSNEQIDSTLADIFNTTDLTGVRALLNQCGDAYDELYEKIENSSGSAAEMYGIQMNTLEGDIQALKSKAEGLGVSFYNGINTPLRGAVQYATELVEKLKEKYDEGGITELIGGIGDILADIVTKSVENLPEIVKLGTRIITTLLQSLVDNSDVIAPAITEIINVLVESMGTVMPLLLSAAGTILSGIAEGTIQNLPMIIEMAGQLILMLVDGLISAAPMIVYAVIALIGAMGDTLASMAPQLSVMSIQLITVLAEALLNNVDVLISTAIEIMMALGETTIELLPTIVSSLIDVIINTDWLDVGLRIVKGIGKGFLKGLKNAFSGSGEETASTYTSAMNASKSNVVSAAESLNSNISSVLGNSKITLPNYGEQYKTAFASSTPVVVSAAEGINKSIQDTADKTNLTPTGERVIDGLIKGMNNKRGELNATSTSIAKSVSDMMNKALDIHSPSRVMRGTGVNIVKGLVNGIDSMLSTAELKALELAGAVQIGEEKPKLSEEDIAFTSGGGDTYNSSSDYNNSKTDIKLYVTNVIKSDGDIEKAKEKIQKMLAEALNEVANTSGQGVHA